MVEIAVPLFIFFVVAKTFIELVQIAKDVSDKYRGKPTPDRSHGKGADPSMYDRVHNPRYWYLAENIHSDKDGLMK